MDIGLKNEWVCRHKMEGWKDKCGMGAESISNKWTVGYEIDISGLTGHGVGGWTNRCLKKRI